jgi:hypothetical protein
LREFQGEKEALSWAERFEKHLFPLRQLEFKSAGQADLLGRDALIFQRPVKN